MTGELNRRGFVKGSTVAVAGAASILTSSSIAGAQSTDAQMPTTMDGAAPVQGARGIERCPVMNGTNAYKATGSFANQHWWPNQLNLKVLHQHSALSDPMGAGFSYAEAFKTVDLEALRTDIDALMTASQDWWPADHGH